MPVMTRYQGTAERPDQVKALAGVLLVHALLGVLVLTGLDVASVSRTIDGLKTFDVRPVPPPPPPPTPPPRSQAARAAQAEGASGKKAEATPIAVPVPRIVLPVRSPVIAARVPATGSASRSGAAVEGTGPGSGGSGNGPGGGGNGAGAGGGIASPARWIAGGLSDRDNRGGRFEGVVSVRFTVMLNGRIQRCRVERSSGDRELDFLTCRLLEQRMQFIPAHDAAGQPVPVEIGTTYTWGIRGRPRPRLN